MGSPAQFVVARTPHGTPLMTGKLMRLLPASAASSLVIQTPQHQEQENMYSNAPFHRGLFVGLLLCVLTYQARFGLLKIIYQ